MFGGEAKSPEELYPFPIDEEIIEKRKKKEREDDLKLYEEVKRLQELDRGNTERKY